MANSIPISEEHVEQVRLPTGAEPWAAELRAMMLRIPAIWGRSLSCGPGWFPLLVELDHELQQLAPDYAIEQVKEKYGSLRFYASSNLTEVTITDDPEPDLGEYPGQVAAHEAWEQRYDAYLDSPAGQQAQHIYTQRAEAFEQAISRAEDHSEVSCEICGADGQLLATAAPSPWYLTRCPEHTENGQIPAGEWESWWAAEQPQRQARQRADFCSDHNQDRALVVAAVEHSVRLAIRASYIHDVELAHEVAGQDWDLVWLSDDPISLAFLDQLKARFQEELEEIAARRAGQKADSPRLTQTQTQLAGLPQFYFLPDTDFLPDTGHLSEYLAVFNCSIAPTHAYHLLDHNDNRVE